MPIMFGNQHPFKTISIWTGTLASIPDGWALCDGTNGTPDLRSRFIRGAPNATEPGTLGGSDTHALSTAELPIHGHPVTDPNHSHFLLNSTAVIDIGTTASTMTLSTTSLSGISTSSTGSGSAHENRPAYFEVAFIMKVSDNA